MNIVGTTFKVNVYVEKGCFHPIKGFDNVIVEKLQSPLFASIEGL
jgi:hypothetical protein